MNSIDFIYTSTISQVCTPSEMLYFFEYLKENTNNFDINLEIIILRLYKRYIRFEELSVVLQEINSISTQLEKDHRNSHYANMKNICDSLRTVVNDVHYFKKTLNFYDPIRIGITEITSFEDQFRDLSEYDNLQGPPFWLREYLQEYPDTVLPFE